MPFEHAIPASERPQAHASERAATGISCRLNSRYKPNYFPRNGLVRHNIELSIKNWKGVLEPWGMPKVKDGKMKEKKRGVTYEAPKQILMFSQLHSRYERKGRSYPFK
jgi:hypothetical protein